jgi:hypothetical protein
VGFSTIINFVKLSCVLLASEVAVVVLNMKYIVACRPVAKQ